MLTVDWWSCGKLVFRLHFFQCKCIKLNAFMFLCLGSAVPAPRPAVVSPPSPTALDVSVLLSADSDLSSSADSVDSEALDKTSGRHAGEQDGDGEASAEGEGLAQLLKDQKLQEKIISMRDTLQWYHDMKMEYRYVGSRSIHLFGIHRFCILTAVNLMCKINFAGNSKKRGSIL